MITSVTTLDQRRRASHVGLSGSVLRFDSASDDLQSKAIALLRSKHGVALERGDVTYCKRIGFQRNQMFPCLPDKDILISQLCDRRSAVTAIDGSIVSVNHSLPPTLFINDYLILLKSKIYYEARHLKDNRDKSDYVYVRNSCVYIKLISEDRDLRHSKFPTMDDISKFVQNQMKITNFHFASD